jgi:chemotaxis protein CheX
MDDTVGEVFQTMLERSCPALDDACDLPTHISARITFSGTLEAQCEVEFPASSAQRLTHAFLGSGDAEWDDSIIGDAVGELCNMIAGGWKQRLGASAEASDLSVPSISRGQHRNITDAGPMRVRRAYTFDSSTFVVSMTML